MFRCLKKGEEKSIVSDDGLLSTKSRGPVLPTSDLSTVNSWMALFLQSLMTTDCFPSK